MWKILHHLGVEISPNSFKDAIGALEFFQQKKNCFYPNCIQEFPRLTTEELELLAKGAGITSFYRDGLDIFGGPGTFIQRTKPGTSDDIEDLTGDPDIQVSGKAVIERCNSTE